MARKADPAVRERILQEAEHIIHLKGYNHACLDEIAQACGMTKGNLLHHYNSKSELALAVLDYKIKDLVKDLSDLIERLLQLVTG